MAGVTLLLCAVINGCCEQNMWLKLVYIYRSYSKTKTDVPLANCWWRAVDVVELRVTRIL